MINPFEAATVSRVAYLLAALSLVFTITNYAFLSCLFIVLSLVAIIFMASPTLKLTRLHLAIISLYIYFLFSVLFYSPSALIDFDFYRRDGNFFITFLPMLLYGFFPIELDVRRLLYAYLIWVTLANALGIVCFLFRLLPNDREYTFFFHAHNAAGGFLCAILGACLIMFFYRRDILSLLMAVVNLLGVYFTNSRGSIFGLCASLFLVLILRGKHIKKLIFSAVLGLGFLLTWTYPVWKEYGMRASAHSIDLVDDNLFDRVGTVVDRGFFLWPRALYLWLQSPLIGTGFGSYNDIPYDLVGKEHFIHWNRPENFIYSDAHAHHSFLHILAETGLLGLALTIVVLIRMYEFILSMKDQLVSKVFLVIFWVNVWSSFTEHRLFTPSQVLPFSIFMGLAMSYRRFTYKKYHPPDNWVRNNLLAE